MTHRSTARSLRTMAVAAAAIVGSTLAGPSADALSISFGNKLDMGKLRSAIEANAKQAYKGFPVGKAVCPKSRSMKKGDVFDCTIPVSDGILTIAVTQSDANGNARFVAKEAVLDLAKARTFIATQIEQQTGVEADVDCGRTKVKMIAPGKVLSCTATDGSDTLKVKLLVKDTSGNVSMSTE
jgi:hypothetical protein